VSQIKHIYYNTDITEKKIKQANIQVNETQNTNKKAKTYEYTKNTNYK